MNLLILSSALSFDKVLETNAFIVRELLRLQLPHAKGLDYLQAFFGRERFEFDFEDAAFEALRGLDVLELREDKFDVVLAVDEFGNVPSKYLFVLVELVDVVVNQQDLFLIPLGGFDRRVGAFS